MVCQNQIQDNRTIKASISEDEDILIYDTLEVSKPYIQPLDNSSRSNAADLGGVFHAKKNYGGTYGIFHIGCNSPANPSRCARRGAWRVGALSTSWKATAQTTPPQMNSVHREATTQNTKNVIDSQQTVIVYKNEYAYSALVFCFVLCDKVNYAVCLF